MADPRKKTDASPDRGATGARGGARAAVVEPPEALSDGLLCICCKPENPLVLRADLGQMADGSPKYAICVLHEPDPSVYKNRGDGKYEWLKQLRISSSGELVDEHGAVVARVENDAFQRLTTLDDDEEQPPGGGGAAQNELSSEGSPSEGSSNRPSTHHVDLSQDDFYRL